MICIYIIYIYIDRDIYIYIYIFNISPNPRISVRRPDVKLFALLMRIPSPSERPPPMRSISQNPQPSQSLCQEAVRKDHAAAENRKPKPRAANEEAP